MNFDLDEMQTMLKDSVSRWAEKEYDFESRRKLVHEGGGFSETHWATFVEMGWLGASLSEEQGGFGGSANEAAVLMEEFGKVLLVEPFLAVGVLAMQTLLAIGGERAAELVGAIVMGEDRIVFAHEEPASRGVLSHVETKADGDGRLTGTKTLVLGGPFATKLAVSARTTGSVDEAAGIALYLVDADAEGVSRRDYRLADGSRASEITFTGAKAELLADDAFAAIATGYAHATVALCAEAIGAMDRALWITRDYLKTRKQFGQPIGNFQALQHRMSDMLIEVELSRSTLYRALGHLGAEPAIRDRAVSTCKAQIGKSARFVGGQAIQLHGGIGVTEEYSIGHYFKRLNFIDNAFGSTAKHLDRLARAIQTEVV